MQQLSHARSTVYGLSLFLILLLTPLSLIPAILSSSGETFPPLREMAYGPGEWTPHHNVTVFSLCTDIDGMVIEAQFRVLRGGIWGSWMDANVSGRGPLNLTATIGLKEGEVVYYQFRALSDEVVLATFPIHHIGCDSRPPEVVVTELPQGTVSSIPPITLEAHFGPSGPSWEFPIDIIGANWTVRGTAHLFTRGDGGYVASAFSFEEEMGEGEVQVVFLLADGAGNSVEVRFSLRLSRRTVVESVWPTGEVLREGILSRGYIIDSVKDFESAERIYLYCASQNRTFIFDGVEGETLPEAKISLKTPSMETVLRALSPGRYFWQAQIKINGGDVFTTRSAFTLVGGLEDIHLGLPTSVESKSKVHVNPPPPLTADLLKGVPGLNYTALSPSGEIVDAGFLPLLPGYVIELPFYSLPYPVYVRFPTGDTVRVEPPEESWNVSLLPGVPADVRITSPLLGIDPSTLSITLPDGHKWQPWQEVKVFSEEEISSGEEAPTVIELPLYWINRSTGGVIEISFRDALPLSPLHNFTIMSEDIPPPPRVLERYSEGRLFLWLESDGWGRVPIENVELFRVVEGRAVSPGEGVEVNLTREEITVIVVEQTELLVRIYSRGDVFVWRGEVAPPPEIAAEIRWEVSGDWVHLWVKNLPRGTEEVVWNVGGVNFRGRAITVPLKEVGGKEVSVTVVTEEGPLALTTEERLPVYSGEERAIPILPIILVVVLAILLFLEVYPGLRTLLPVKMDLVEEKGIPAAGAATRPRGGRRAVLQGAPKGRPGLPSPTAKSFAPRSRVKGGEEIYNCAICLKPILPPEEPIKCTCGERFHKTCAIRKGICPRCGRDIMVEEGDLI